MLKDLETYPLPFELPPVGESIDRVNGLDLIALLDVIDDIKRDPDRGRAIVHVASTWMGHMRHIMHARSCEFGGDHVPRRYALSVDEPHETPEGDSAAAPQELFVTAFNSCFMVSFLISAAVKGIELDRLQLVTVGELDMRRILGVEGSNTSGYEALRCVVRVKGDAKPEEFSEIYEAVMRTSPAFLTLTQAVHIDTGLVVE